MMKDEMDESQKDQMDTQNDNFSLVSAQTQEAHLGHKTPKFENCESVNCGNKKKHKRLANSQIHNSQTANLGHPNMQLKSATISLVFLLGPT